MKTNYKLPVAMLAGIAHGSLGMQILKARKSPAAFCIAEVEVSDQDQYGTYPPGVPATSGTSGMSRPERRSRHQSQNGQE